MFSPFVIRGRSLYLFHLSLLHVYIVAPALEVPKSESLVEKRQCSTFWTACASCNEKKKCPIEDLNHDLLCHNCHNRFTALETQRPRNQGTSTSLIQFSGTVSSISLFILFYPL